MKKMYLIITMALLSFLATGQDLSGYQEIANYPFLRDGKDASGNYADATIINSPFANGGIYSNGIYRGNDTSGSVIKTPDIGSLNMAAFAVQVEFNADTSGLWILVCGDSWRWMQAYTNLDSTLEVRVSKTDGFDQIIYSTFKVNPGIWYKLGLLYDSTSKDLSVYMDDKLVVTDKLTAHLKHSNNIDFVNQQSGMGFTFKGYWKNLKILNQKPTGLQKDDKLMNAVYYSPAYASIYLNQTGKAMHYTLFNVAGQIMQSGNLTPGQDRISVNGYEAGIYLLKMENEVGFGTFKFVIE